MKELKPTKQDEWKEISGFAPKHDFEVNPEIIGILQKATKDTGKYKSNLYEISTSEGLRAVWGSSGLNDRMDLIPVGALVKIVYRGKAKTSKKRSVKVFSVYHQLEKDLKLEKKKK